MQLIQTLAQLNSPTAPSIGNHAILVANVVRVWADDRGKTHFEYGVVVATRDPQTCSHGGTFAPGGAVRGHYAYTWAHSSLFHLRCGDCGKVLE